MSTQTEIEVKLLLSGRDDYEKAVKLFVGDQETNAPLIQTDVYLDSPDKRISKSGSYLRMRSTGNGHVLTLKKPIAGISDGIASRIELNQPITAETAAIIIGTQDGEVDTSAMGLDDSIIKTTLDGWGVCRLKQWGKMRNMRIVAKWGSGNTFVEIDLVEHGDGERFYEIEVEMDESERVQKELENSLVGAGIFFTRTITSKSKTSESEHVQEEPLDGEPGKGAEEETEIAKIKASEPEHVQKELEGLLTANGISFTRSAISKFERVTGIVIGLSDM